MHFRMKRYSLLLALAGITLFAGAQEPLDKHPATDNPDNIPYPVFPVPSDRQMDWFETEFYGFSHYGPNTFVGTEWGNDRKPNPKEYAPSQMPDCDQWVKAMHSAGMRGMVVVCKHHDGFCLWPTKSTDFNVRNGAGVSPQVDIPLMVSEACKRYGMKFGVYVSPWDASNPHYGTDKYVTDVLLKQITELCTNYGKLFEIWFDGANGGNGYYGGDSITRKTIDKRVYYDWENIADSIHKMQPGCVVWGREFRWCGNEDGYSGKTCWSNFNQEEIYIETKNNSGMEDGLLFLPSEVDVRTTSKWFWTEDEKSKTAEQLYRIYLESVGRNATLIMNCAPDKYGKMPDDIVENLGKLGVLLKQRLGNDIAKGKLVVADKVRKGQLFDASNITDDNKDTYWATDDCDNSGSFVIDLGEVRNIHYVMLQEYIRLGQRVRSFTIETSNDNITWQMFAAGTTIGYKRIMAENDDTSRYGNGVNARYVRVNITDSKSCLLISNVSVF